VIHHVVSTALAPTQERDSDSRRHRDASPEQWYKTQKYEWTGSVVWNSAEFVARVEVTGTRAACALQVGMYGIMGEREMASLSAGAPMRFQYGILCSPKCANSTRTSMSQPRPLASDKWRAVAVVKSPIRRKKHTSYFMEHERHFLDSAISYHQSHSTVVLHCSSPL
jgi:hypothetical protein